MCVAFRKGIYYGGSQLPWAIALYAMDGVRSANSSLRTNAAMARGFAEQLGVACETAL
jgi:hypothetical protein